MNSYKLAFQVDSTVPTCRYIISLSDGRTVYENYVPEMRTSWMRLKQYLDEPTNDLTITRLRLQCGDRTVSIEPASAYFIFYQENTGLYSDKLIAIGSYLPESELLKVRWFNLRAEEVKKEVRQLRKDHPGLIFSEPN